MHVEVGARMHGLRTSDHEVGVQCGIDYVHACLGVMERSRFLPVFVEPPRVTRP